MKHKLKILPAHFKAISDGIKRFEIRNNSDRGFQKGDIVVLEEAVDGEYTGLAAHVEITYVSNFNQPVNKVVFGFKVIEIF